MAAPKRKASKSRSSRKHAYNLRVSMPLLVESKEPGRYVRRHRVDPFSGQYRGREILIPEQK